MQKKPLKFLSILLSLLLIFQQTGFAQTVGQLDISGHLLQLRNNLIIDKFRPPHLRYFSYDIATNNFCILLDKGDLRNSKDEDLQNSSRTLLNYFLIGVTLPDDKFWVNLRPDSESNIIDGQLAQTDIGKIFLEADLQLKKDTARFTSPQTPEGREYWDKLYKKAGELFGYDNITIPTLTRPWIVPDEIIIRETKDSAYVYKATLKVLLEQDHLKGSTVYNFDDPRLKELNEYSSQVIRETILPKLTKEINISKRYAPLKQVFYSLILSRWFKSRFSGKNNLYSNSINRSDLTGLTSKEYWSKTTYFKQYQKSFKDGEYNIQEPVSTPFGQAIRSYFSGGIDATLPMVATRETPEASASPVGVNPGTFRGNAERNLAEVFIGKGEVVGFEGKAGKVELKKVEVSPPPNVSAKDKEFLGSEGRYASEATFEEVFASEITVYSDGRFSFVDQGESYQGRQVFKSLGEAALTSDEQEMWNNVLDVFTHVFARSKIFKTGQTFRRSFRLFESEYNSTVFIHRVGNRTVFYVNRKWLQNLISLREQLGHNGTIQGDKLPKAMRDEGVESANLIDSIIYAVAFHEIGGHHWDGQTRDDYGDTFEVRQGQETNIQAFRGGLTYGDFNTAAYRMYLNYAGISTLNLDSGIASLDSQRRSAIEDLSTFFNSLITTRTPATPILASEGGFTKKNWRSIEEEFTVLIQAASSLEELKRVYREMALKVHPDKNRGDEKNAEEVFKRLAQMVETRLEREFGVKAPSDRGADKDFGFGWVSDWAVAAAFYAEDNENVMGEAIKALQKRARRITKEGEARIAPVVQILSNIAPTLSLRDLEDLLNIASKDKFVSALMAKLPSGRLSRGSISDETFWEARPMLERLYFARSLQGGEIVHIRRGNELIRAVILSPMTQENQRLKVIMVTAPFGLLTMELPQRIFDIEASEIVSPAFDLEREPTQKGWDINIGDRLKLDVDFEGKIVEGPIIATVIAAYGGAYTLIADRQIHNNMENYGGYGLVWGKWGATDALKAGKIIKVTPRLQPPQNEIPAKPSTQATNVRVISPDQIQIGDTNVGIIQGDITQVRSEAVVPGVNTSMGVGMGVTGAIIRAVGSNNAAKVFPPPQRAIGRNSFEVGDAYVASLEGISTRAGWKYVISAMIHTGEPWGDPTEQSVKASTKKALEEASKRGVTSITFPAFGTGILGMDFNTSARSMYAGIQKFLTENPTTSLRDIKVVLFDLEGVRPFRQELDKLAQDVSQKTVRTSVSRKEGEPVSKTKVDLVRGDITIEPAEAVIAPVDSSMAVGLGVTGAIIRALGGTEQARSQAFPTGEYHQVGSAKIASVGNLKNSAGWKYVIRAVIHHNGFIPGLEDISKATENALVEANRAGVTSVTLPAFGTGVIGLPYTISAREMIAGVNAFLGKNPNNNIKQIKFVLSEQEAMAPFRNELAGIRGDEDLPSSGSPIWHSEGDFKAGNSRRVSTNNNGLGGIDFRAMNILVQPMGNFSGLDFTLPKLNNLTSINLDEEFGQIQNMVASGIIPSGARIKELIAACSQKEEINSRVDDMIVCLADIFRLEEESLTESSPEIKESLVILDWNRFVLQ